MLMIVFAYVLPLSVISCCYGLIYTYVSRHDAMLREGKPGKQVSRLVDWFISVQLIIIQNIPYYTHLYLLSVVFYIIAVYDHGLKLGLFPLWYIQFMMETFDNPNVVVISLMRCMCVIVPSRLLSISSAYKIIR